MKPVKKYKISRRLQMPVFEKCQTQKYVLRQQRRQPQRRGRGAPSEFGKQLQEKQKVRYLYAISESTLKGYVTRALRQKEKLQAFETFLERRLDNVVYRLGLAETRRMARQLVSHGHITVHGRKMTVPSYEVRDTDVVSIREGSRKSPLFSDLFTTGASKQKRAEWVAWHKGQGTIKGAPRMSENTITVSSILEYYSR